MSAPPNADRRPLTAVPLTFPHANRNASVNERAGFKSHTGTLLDSRVSADE